MNNNTALTMKVFNYKDKEAMMKAARLKKKEIFSWKQPVMFYQDVAPGVTR